MCHFEITFKAICDCDLLILKCSDLLERIFFYLKNKISSRSLGDLFFYTSVWAALNDENKTVHAFTMCEGQRIESLLN